MQEREGGRRWGSSLGGSRVSGALKFVFAPPLLRLRVSFVASGFFLTLTFAFSSSSLTAAFLTRRRRFKGTNLSSSCRAVATTPSMTVLTAPTRSPNICIKYLPPASVASHGGSPSLLLSSTEYSYRVCPAPEEAACSRAARTLFMSPRIRPVLPLSLFDSRFVPPVRRKQSGGGPGLGRRRGAMRPASSSRWRPEVTSPWHQFGTLPPSLAAVINDFSAFRISSVVGSAPVPVTCSVVCKSLRT
mmetsp:Transcript_18568/g.43591  ORF Transcript_18568/g.43591 Transcript_18568/m.43591 type:complete len:245 (-) Transcript_18568:66-800(-)